MRLFSDVAADIDDPFLARALVLAQRGRGTTAPNPMVGCVLVRDGHVVGEGYHERAGGPHAEIHALRAAGDLARGAVAYVTLEPCNHQGLTPPCTDALIQAGVASVVIGMPDPNDAASGGAEALMAAGIAVAFSEDPAPFVELNEAWLHALFSRRPYVHVKVALSLDGSPTGAPGVRSRVTGAGSRGLTMRMRAAADAVLVGAATAACDAPSLVVRDPGSSPAQRQPLRVVLGRKGVADAQLFHDGLGEAVALIPEDIEPPHGVVAVRYDASGDSSAGLHAAFRALGSRGVRRVLVEAGPTLFSALWDADLVDELTLIHAGGVFGTDAPKLYVGDRVRGSSDVGTDLQAWLVAFEAGVIDGDAVSSWRPRETHEALTRPRGESE